MDRIQRTAGEEQPRSSDGSMRFIPRTATPPWRHGLPERGAGRNMRSRIASVARTARYRWFQTHARPVRPEGRTVTWLGTSTDIEDQARIREALERSGEELERRVYERTAGLQQALDTLHVEARERSRAEERLASQRKAEGDRPAHRRHRARLQQHAAAIMSCLGLIPRAHATEAAQATSSRSSSARKKARCAPRLSRTVCSRSLASMNGSSRGSSASTRSRTTWRT